MKIQKLPPELRTKLESGVIITDVVQCVLELVRNSLDADASGIAVRVNLKNFHLKVIDNGKGIEKDDLELVGERFMTSKYYIWNNFSTSATYGYKGQALSSMLDFCQSLTIKTKSKNDGPTLVKMFVKGKAGSITELDDNNCGTGTTIIIENFMCTMPVRRKRIKEVFEMEEIKVQLQYLALIHYNVCFTLRNENKGLILLQTAQASSMLEMISNLYGKTTAKSLKTIKYEENNYRVSGYASAKLLKQNSNQIVYLNRQVIARGVIHKFINNIMIEYSENKTLMTDSPAEQILKKLKNSHHFFIVEIKCPFDYYELFTNLKKTRVEFKNWKDVLKCIHRGLKKAYKFDFDGLDDSVNDADKDAGKFGTSVLVNALKGVPATRCFKKSIGIKKQSKKISKKASCYENNENSKPILIDSEEKGAECTIDTLETPIPKNIKGKKPGRRKLSCTKAHPDMSYIEFYKWLKASFQTDTNAFNLYSEFLQYKNKKTVEVIENFKSPVLSVKLKRKRIDLLKSKTPEKKQRTMQKGSATLSKEIAFVAANSQKILPNVNLRIKKSVQFNNETRFDLPVFPNFDCIKSKKRNDEIFKKPLTPIGGRKQVEMIQNLPSPASSEIHFTNIIKFRNLQEPLRLETPPLQDKSYTNSWVSHYKDVRSDNFLHFSNTKQKFFKRHSKEKVRFRDVIIQTSCLEIPQKMNAMVQTSQTILESNFDSNPGSLINKTPLPEFWNISPPENHTFCDLNESQNIISSKMREQKQTSSGEFIRSQMPKSHSNSKSNTETQTFPNLWTDSLSEFGNPTGQDLDSNAQPDSLPKTIPLEEICSPQFCLTERHDFVPKGLSPKFFNSEAVEIPSLGSFERNRIQVTIDDVRNELSTVKWQDESTGKCAKPPIPDGVIGEMQINGKRKSINFENQILSASLSYSAIKVHNLLHSFTLTKEVLSTVEVLGQLDEKFIVTKMKIHSPKNMELISLLDQHAVDERIRLEKIINEYTVSDKFVSTALSHSLELTFSQSQVQIIMDLREKMSNFGFEIKPTNQGTILVDSVPSFLLDKYKKESKKNSPLEDTLQTVILGIMNEISETRGAVPKIPKIMHDAFSSEACHSAVKFNKALTKETMTKMMSNLKNCKLPFQCAHGRPSVIPIIDLEDFTSTEEENDYTDLSKIKKFYKERSGDTVASISRE